MDRLQEIEDEITRLRTKIGLLAQERDRLRQEKAGVYVGDIVQKGGKLYRVTDVNTHWEGKPWLKGSPQRKDGSYGTAERNLFSDWTKE